MIDIEFYTAHPAGENASHLNNQYRQLLRSNLTGYLNSIQNALCIDISFIISKYEKIDCSKNFSPAIYHLFSKLTEVSKSGAVPKIIDVLHQLKLLNSSEIFNSEFQLTTILTEPWEIDFVNKIRSEHIPGKSGDETVVLPILNPDLASITNIVSNLTSQIQIVDFDFYCEFQSYVTRLKIFNGKALKAATSASVFGAIYMNLPPNDENSDVYFAEHIIHETSHLHLDILLAFDKILLNDEKEKFKAPIRIDPRPMFGIFHATFVLSRMIRLFQRIIIDKPSKAFGERLEVFHKQFESGLNTIEKHALLTSKGKKIKDSFVKVSEI